MAHDYVPHSDAEFLNWTRAYRSYAVDHLAQIGLTPDDLAAIEGEMAAFQESLNTHTAARNAAQAARQVKVASRARLETRLRSASRRVQVHPTTTDGDRAGLGITVPDLEQTPVAVQETRPLVTVHAAQRLRHEIRWRDQMTGRRAKPCGIAGCEVWVKIGEPPADPSELRFVAMNGRACFVAEYNGEDGGRIAHYMLRWVNRKGQKGPWSETVSATIQN